MEIISSCASKITYLIVDATGDTVSPSNNPQVLLSLQPSGKKVHPLYIPYYFANDQIKKRLCNQSILKLSINKFT